MITPVNLEDIQRSILQSDEDRDTLQRVREHACNNTGEIVKTEDGEWVLYGADYEGKLSDLTVKAGGHVEIKNSYRTTGRTRGRARPLVAANDNGALIQATPWTFKYPNTIPPRQWIYGTHYIRKFVSVTVSPGGVGKTSKSIVEALSIATGRDLLNEAVHERARVWLWNGEDPRDELDRRIAAACTLYEIKPDDLDGWLFVDSGREHQIVTAIQTRDGTEIAIPVMNAMIRTIEENKIDVVIIDPFVSSHAVSENDNMAMDGVIKRFWAPLIDRTNCSVELIHHAKKTGGFEVTAESARGAVALIGQPAPQSR